MSLEVRLFYPLLLLFLSLDHINSCWVRAFLTPSFLFLKKLLALWPVLHNLLTKRPACYFWNCFWLTHNGEKSYPAQNSRGQSYCSLFLSIVHSRLHFTQLHLSAGSEHTPQKFTFLYLEYAYFETINMSNIPSISWLYFTADQEPFYINALSEAALSLLSLTGKSLTIQFQVQVALHDTSHGFCSFGIYIPSFLGSMDSLWPFHSSYLWQAAEVVSLRL